MTYGVLGGNGFLGQHIIKELENNGLQAIPGSRRNGVDATDTHGLVRWIIDNKITKLINAAAECGGIGLNDLYPADLWKSSTMISYSVLEAARITNIEHLVMIGTVCSYAKFCITPFKESDLMNYGFPEETNAAYGVSKLNALFGCMAYRKQHDMTITYMIPVNLYGPNDNFDEVTSHVIPAIIDKMLIAQSKNEKSIKLWGDGSPTREFLYVKDAANAIVTAFNYKCELPLNIGTGKSITIKELAQTIAQIIGYDGEIIWDNAKPNGQPQRQLDVSRIRSELNWQATTSLYGGLLETINWRQRNG